MIKRRDFIALTGAGGAAWFAAGIFPPAAQSPQKEERNGLRSKRLHKLIGMPGFSETLLKNHFTLYQGYVTNTNKVLDTLAADAQGRQDGDPGICRAQAAARLGVQRHAAA